MIGIKSLTQTQLVRFILYTLEVLSRRGMLGKNIRAPQQRRV